MIIKKEEIRKGWKERGYSGGGNSEVGDLTQKERRSGGEEAFGSGIQGVWVETSRQKDENAI